MNFMIILNWAMLMSTRNNDIKLKLDIIKERLKDVGFQMHKQLKMNLVYFQYFDIR